MVSPILTSWLSSVVFVGACEVDSCASGKSDVSDLRYALDFYSNKSCFGLSPCRMSKIKSLQ